MSSLSNAGVSLLAAQALPLDAFGVVSVAFITYTLLLNVTRPLCSEPLAVRFSTTHGSALCNGVQGSITAALAIAGGLAGLLLAVAPLLAPHFTPAMQALGLFLPGLLVQDAWRYAFVTAGQPKRALVNDLVWLASALPLLWLALRPPEPTASAVISAWGASALVAALFGFAQQRMLPDFGSVITWLRSHCDLGARFLAEFFFKTAGGYATMVGLAAVAGSAAVGALRGAQVLLSPISFLFLGAALVSVPESARLWQQHGARGLVAASALLSGCLSVGALVVGSSLLLLPRGVGMAVLGDTWAHARPLLTPVTVAVAGNGIALGAISGLRVLESARRTLQISLVIAPVTATGGILTASRFGPMGAAVALAIASLASAALAWCFLVHELRAHREHAGEFELYRRFADERGVRVPDA